MQYFLFFADSHTVSVLIHYLHQSQFYLENVLIDTKLIIMNKKHCESYYMYLYVHALA